MPLAQPGWLGVDARARIVELRLVVRARIERSSQRCRRGSIATAG